MRYSWGRICKVWKCWPRSTFFERSYQWISSGSSWRRLPISCCKVAFQRTVTASYGNLWLGRKTRKSRKEGWPLVSEDPSLKVVGSNPNAGKFCPHKISLNSTGSSCIVKWSNYRTCSFTYFRNFSIAASWDPTRLSAASLTRSWPGWIPRCSHLVTNRRFVNFNAEYVSDRSTLSAKGFCCFSVFSWVKQNNVIFTQVEAIPIKDPTFVSEKY